MKEAKARGDWQGLFTGSCLVCAYGAPPLGEVSRSLGRCGAVSAFAGAEMRGESIVNRNSISEGNHVIYACI